jgi:hypothetical protein
VKRCVVRVPSNFSASLGECIRLLAGAWRTAVVESDGTLPIQVCWLAVCLFKQHAHNSTTRAVLRAAAALQSFAKRHALYTPA